MKFLILSFLILTHLQAIARVDCTLTVKETTRVFQHVEIGPMVTRFNLRMLIGGQLVNRKIGLSMGNDSTDESSGAELITISYNDMNELVNMGSFNRGKKLNSMSFNALIPQIVQMEMGDALAGEETTVVVCEIK